MDFLKYLIRTYNKLYYRELFVLIHIYRGAFLEVAFWMVSLFLMTILYKNNFSLFFILLSFSLSIIIIRRNIVDIFFFFVGAVFGTFLIFFSVQFGVLKFANPGCFGGVPYWVPLMAGLTSLLIRRIVKTSIKIEKKWKKLPELAKEKGLFE